MSFDADNDDQCPTYLQVVKSENKVLVDKLLHPLYQPQPASKFSSVKTFFGWTNTYRDVVQTWPKLGEPPELRKCIVWDQDYDDDKIRYHDNLDD